VSGKVFGAAHYTLILLARDGRFRSVKLDLTGKFTFSDLPRDLVRGATLQLVNPEGRYFGPIVLAHSRATSAAYTALSRTGRGRKIKVGRIALETGYGRARRVRRALIDRSAPVDASSDGEPVGANKAGLVQTAPAGGVAGGADEVTDDTAEGGADLDGDGIPNAVDVDDDGDLNLDGTDGDSAQSSARFNPFSTLFLPMSQTLNVNVGPVTRASIDALIGSENVFNLIFYLQQLPDAPPATGAHVICPSSLVYCRSAADGGATAMFGGVTESSPDLFTGPWSDYNADGSGYPNLEPIDAGPSRVFVASIQPRVGTTQFRPGDVYQVEFVSAEGVVSSMTLSLAPYFVTVPAVSSYDAGAGAVTVDYSNPSAPGRSSANPIVLSAEGTLRLALWRPQRLAIEGAESGEYRDMGRLHYGVIIGGVVPEPGCAGQYSDLSPTLTETPGAGGPNLWPLADGAADAVPDPASTISFTVDLARCLADAAAPPGTYLVALTAAGEALSGGANRAAQMLHVTIP
jgi:hypothetical protein